MKKLYKIWFGVFCLIAILVFTPNLFALNFQIDKGKVRVSLPPGWSDGGIITIDNRDDKPLKVRAYISDWDYSDSDGAKVFLSANTTPKSCADWIKFYPADFTVPAFEKQKINFVVEVPKDAVGGHYAVLFFEVQTGVIYDEAKGTNVKIYNRLGTLFYIEPEGTIDRNGALSDFKIDALSGAVKARVMFQNTGNVDITARGTFDIINEEGFVFLRGKFKDAYTMPEDVVSLSASSTGEILPKGIYDVIVTFDLGGTSLVGEWQIEIDDLGEIVSVKKL